MWDWSADGLNSYGYVLSFYCVPSMVLCFKTAVMNMTGNGILAFMEHFSFHLRTLL